MIVLVTDNPRKLEEHRRIFGRYNVRLRQRGRAGFSTEELERWFAEDPKLVAVLDETSQITTPDTQDHLHDWRDPAHHLRAVVNRGNLWAWVRTAEGIVEERYRREIEGWLDHTRHVEGDDVFDWDALFVVGATGLTYDQMRRRGLKSSVRDLLVSDFLIAHLYFDERVDLAWTPQHPERAVDFGRSVADFLAAHEHVDRAALAPYGLTALLDHVTADGVFFRASENRRQRNYWAPGLNGGIPLTPKRDAVHEITFMVHDLMHQVLPDLVFTGVPDGEDHATWRNVYSAWRMISEAFTLVLADMLFVDSLARGGLDYDFGKRKIWPLFACLSLDFEGDRDGSLRRLLYANTRYALAGDDSEWRALRGLGVPDARFEKALADYEGKYEGYFRADWSWTVNNFEAMAARSEVFERWARLVGDEGFARCRLAKLDDVARALEQSGAALGTLDEVVEAVFELAIAHLLERTVPPRPHGAEEQRVNAARRFFTGQLLLFAAWDVLPTAAQLGASIGATLGAPLTTEIVARIEARFAQHLEDMVARQLISEDDRRTWLGAHPLFDPSYVAYDRKAGDVASLRETAEACFATPAAPSAVGRHGDAAFVDLERLWASVRGVPHAARLARLLEGAGATFHDPERAVVKEPAVAIVGIGGLPVRLRDGAITLGDASLASTLAATTEMMGFAAHLSYLNPRDRDARAMFEVVTRLGHGSVAHVATVNVLCAGHSSAVEHELACQRDIVHLARLTVARTAAQNEPPLAVSDPSLAPLFGDVRAAVLERVAAARGEGASADELEALNRLFPSAKASLLLVSGSLRSFQKLVAQRDDPGKEAELRALLRTLNRSLHALWPALFALDPEGAS